MVPYTLRIRLTVSFLGLVFVFTGASILTGASTGGGAFLGVCLFVVGLLVLLVPWRKWLLNTLFPAVERSVPPWIEATCNRVRSRVRQ